MDEKARRLPGFEVESGPRGRRSVYSLGADPVVARARHIARLARDAQVGPGSIYAEGHYVIVSASLGSDAGRRRRRKEYIAITDAADEELAAAAVRTLEEIQESAQKHPGCETHHVSPRIVAARWLTLADFAPAFRADTCSCCGGPAHADALVCSLCMRVT